MWVDSHCHLTYDEDAPFLDDILERARAADVGALISIGCRMDEFEKLRALGERYDDVFFSLGIHPHDAADTLSHISLEELLARMRAFTKHPKAVAIGETGLDYYYDHSPREIQKTLFRAQLTLALEEDLPVIIHTRNADEDTLALLKEVGEGKLRGVLHCFSGTRELCEAGLALGLYVSASGIITFKKSDELRAIFKDVPLARLLVETDAPYLAPTPHRGKRNEPSFVSLTGHTLAELRDVTPQEMARITTQNFLSLFTKTRAFYPDQN